MLLWLLSWVQAFGAGMKKYSLECYSQLCYGYGARGPANNISVNYRWLMPAVYIPLLQAIGAIHLNPALALAPIPVSSLPVVYRSLRGSEQVTPAEQEEVSSSVILGGLGVGGAMCVQSSRLHKLLQCATRVLCLCGLLWILPASVMTGPCLLHHGIACSGRLAFIRHQHVFHDGMALYCRCCASAVAAR